MESSNHPEKQQGNKDLYLGYTLVFVASIGIVLLLPIKEVLKDIAVIPGIGSLFLLLQKLWREAQAHERVVDLQYKQQDFMLGTASHMASVVYDKHVEFCEDYTRRVQEGLQELLRSGPTKDTVNIGGDLVRIRIKHAAWLTTQIEEKLKPFEMALIKIGSEWHTLEYLGSGDKRKEIVTRIYDSFGLVIGERKPLSEGEEVAVERVMNHIRELLGIHVLTNLRIKASELALKRAELS